jgi:rhodanese-related sulfurtransferase
VKSGAVNTLAVMACAAVMPFSLAAWQWGFVKRTIRSRHPELRQLSAADLSKWLADKKRRQPLLLDVRSDAEYRVSHIAHAVRIEPGAEMAGAGLPPAKDTPLVTYCSVGYRSADLAEKLRKAGYTNVFNLEGSIFEWVNSGHPVERDGRPVAIVHPYSVFWGRCLNKEHRAEVVPVSR